MLIKSYYNEKRRAEIHREDEGLVVYLFENLLLKEKRELLSYSIHYAETLAEKYIYEIYDTNKQLLTE